MVLGEPGDRVAELVGQPRLLRDLGKNFRCRLFGVARPHKIENAEFHRPLLRFVLTATVTAITLRRQAPGLRRVGHLPRPPHEFRSCGLGRIYPRRGVWYPNAIRIFRSPDLDHIREATMADQEAGSPNAAQIEFWNSAAARAWADQYERMDRAVADLTKALLDLAAPQPGEHVLDIGCGSGTTVLELAARVGPDGHVLGADVSNQSVARAPTDRRRRS